MSPYDRRKPPKHDSRCSRLVHALNAASQQRNDSDNRPSRFGQSLTNVDRIKTVPNADGPSGE
jgi:hypothetical protein